MIKIKNNWLNKSLMFGMIFLVSTISFAQANNSGNEIKEQKEEIVYIIKDPVYDKTQVRPEFPGGTQAFYNFIAKNFKAPKEDVRGKIYINFIVEKDGSLTEFKIMRDLGYGTGTEAIRVLKLSPNWIPGEQDGKKVRVKYSLPISIQG